MATKPIPTNPFYVLLILAGTVFFVTALAYGVMMLRAMRPATDAVQSNPAILNFMQESGNTLILIELVVLGVFTFAAMGTDSYWERRAEKKQEQIDQ